MSNANLRYSTESESGRTILPNDITHSDFASYIHAINDALQSFDYEIRSIHSQTASSRAPEEAIYALVNATSDPQTQLATNHSPDEISFVKRLLDAMFDTNNTPEREVMAVKSMDAVRLAKVDRERGGFGPTPTQPGGLYVSARGEREIAERMHTQGTSQANGIGAASLTLDRAEKVIDSLVDEGWFERSSMGFLSLSPRALMELRTWLTLTYNEPVDANEESEEREWQKIKECEGCKQIVTVGQRCSNHECTCRLHDFCVTTFFRNQPVRKCPFCQSDWTGSQYVGERAARAGSGGSSNRVPNGRMSNGTTATGGGRRGRQTVVEDDSDPDA